MIDSDEKAKVNFINIELTEFYIQTEMFLANNIYKKNYKQIIDNFTQYSDNNFITLLIRNIEAEFITHMEKFFIIYYCQVDKLDRPDISNINHIIEDIILWWQEIL